MNIEQCVFLAANGILTKAQDINGWTDLAEDFWQSRGLIGSRYEYLCGPWLSRWWFHGQRVKELSTIIKRQSRPVIYVGHSYGGALFSALLKSTKTYFPAAHLFAPAVDSDFEKNGFNTALRSGRLGKLFIYGSNNDDVLKYAWASGLGSLGRHGAKNVDPVVADRFFPEWRDNYGHSTWFYKKNLQGSMELTLRV